ncbi:hypothetical protein ASPVEDRAFT_231478 [Aspergillus versicolor CBS 583.65]|uniref:Extracellular membrane protein CFEM domain-containing protein n=1 Tax=Aspergillus versicolor CBS 583.65 TaxID=1036611 RepID=A0A1L9P462_ASPVE|nr:uncharacterized protein ASPVEDRAFT_231478 [Aspergillus versicolor CBS 583.65]OJI96310.1 hypothetical protein ASPVEDRAFT_231478 [Aspergillus versicolor CBS 583.65]
MKFTLVALTSLLALAAAQDSSSSTSDAPATTHSPTPQETCLLACDEKDACCRAKCMNVPCPSDQQANDTNSCVSKCDQGDGSEADAKAYAECQAKCITTTFFPASASATDSASSTSSGESSATTTGSSDDDSDSDSNNDSEAALNPALLARPTLEMNPMSPTLLPSSAHPLLAWLASLSLPGLCKQLLPAHWVTRMM